MLGVETQQDGHGDGLLDNALRVIGRREGLGVYHPESTFEQCATGMATRSS